MDSRSTFLLIIITVCAISLIGLLLISNKQRRKVEDIGVVKQKSDRKNNLIFIYRFYKNVPFLNKFFRKIYSQVKLIYPADEHSINKRVSEILLKDTLIAIGGVILTIFFANGDIYFLLIGILLTYIMVSISTNNRLRKMDDMILRQFGDFLAKVRHHYHDSHIIDRALRNSIDEIPYEIGLHIQRILEIVTSTEMKYEVDRYIGTEPNQYVLMFLSLCVSVQEYGDTQTDKENSIFTNDLNYLKEEVNNEILGRRKNTSAFRSMVGVILAPVIAIKPIEIWAKGSFPEVAQYYNGTYGIVAMILVFVVSFAVYMLVTSLRDGSATQEIEENVWSGIANKPFISDLLERIIAKHYTRYVRYNDALRGMGDHTGAKAFLAKQIGFAIAAFIISYTVMIGSSFTTKATVLKDWEQSFAETVVPSEEYRQNMKNVGKEYAALIKNGKEYTVEELADEIVSTTSVSNLRYATEVATLVLEKVNTYKNTYYRWYQTFIAFAIAIFAFYVPVMFLKWQKSLIEMRKEDEVIRFQSIMLILMHIRGTTLPTILEWMERFAYCFKESITNCHVNIASGTQKALEELKDGESFEPFRDFVDNLIAIDNVGVAKAFEEIQSDRNYYIKKREQDTNDNIEIKSSKARMIMMLPLYTLVAAYMVVPLGMYAFNLMSVFTTITR